MAIYPLVNIQKAIEHGPFIVDLPIKNGDLPIIIITLWLCQQFAIEAMAIEIVNLPSYKLVIFHSSLCKRLAEGITWSKWSRSKILIFF